MNDEHDEDVLNQVDALLDISPSPQSTRRALDKAESRLLECDDHPPTPLTKEPAMTQHKRRRSPLVVCLSVAAAVVLVIAVIGISKLADPGTDHEVAHRDESESDSAAQAEILENAPSQFSRIDKMNRLERESEAPVLTESQVAVDSFSATDSFAESKLNHTDEAETPFGVLSETEGLSKLSQREARNYSEEIRRSLERKSLKQCVDEAKAIVVATASQSAPAPPKRPDDAPENLITFEVKRVLKGALTKKVITTRTPTDPQEFIGMTWIVMLSPEYLAGNHKFAGIYGIKLEPEVGAILSGKP
jgi:hypothetical protein